MSARTPMQTCSLYSATQYAQNHRELCKSYIIHVHPRHICQLSLPRCPDLYARSSNINRHGSTRGSSAAATLLQHMPLLSRFQMAAPSIICLSLLTSRSIVSHVVSVSSAACSLVSDEYVANEPCVRRTLLEWQFTLLELQSGIPFCFVDQCLVG